VAGNKAARGKVNTKGVELMMPNFLVEHAVIILAVISIAAFCFKHRDPRRVL